MPKSRSKPSALIDDNDFYGENCVFNGGLDMMNQNSPLVRQPLLPLRQTSELMIIVRRPAVFHKQRRYIYSHPKHARCDRIFVANVYTYRSARPRGVPIVWYRNSAVCHNSAFKRKFGTGVHPEHRRVRRPRGAAKRAKPIRVSLGTLLIRE